MSEGAICTLLQRIGNVNAPALQMRLMLVQTGEIIWSGKGAVNSNNPLTRDEILSRWPQYRPAVAASQGLAAGIYYYPRYSPYRAARHHDPDAPPAHFYVITAPYPNCRPVWRRERRFYTPGWMAVE